ncbi:CLOCK-interacting pacemaker [Hypomesus transpacificus]|uniref:CLOCK-interacting pacemaker n=1 Tax=Hypomesus transpacificus TaxID=137520 RepID=UPI001F081D4D|nr:CLOCK-interacting pacemaker [Hypomesus transpacificus]
MPNEHSCLSERAPRSSSKTSKAKPLASQGPADTDRSHRQVLRCSSEKDSGYSDNGSDWQQMEGDDQCSCVSEPQGMDTLQGQGTVKPLHQGSTMQGQGTSELTPVYVLKNVVLKKPEPVQHGSDHLIQSQLTWSNTGGPNSSGPTGPTHVILLQPPSMSLPLPSSTKLRKPPSRRTNKKTKGTFLPILNSYTRIAPHPSKKLHDKLPAGLGKVTDSEGQSLSKRICTDDKRDEVSTTTIDLQLPKHHPHKQSDSRVQSLQSQTIAYPPSSPSTVFSSRGCPSVSSSELSTISSSSNSFSSLSATREPHNGLLNAHHRRFHNTLEILSQSGLLDITLRSKDLLSQSKATKRDIAQLRQHTQLLCQAASGRGGVTLESLHQTMEESGVYPTLKCLDKVEALHYPVNAIDPDCRGTVGVNTTLNGSHAQSSPPIVSAQEPLWWNFL